MSGTPIFPMAASTADATAGLVATIDLDLLTRWDDMESLIPLDLSVVSTRKLGVLCNQLYRALDADFPPYGAEDAYDVVVEEFEQRAVRARL